MTTGVLFAASKLYLVPREQAKINSYEHGRPDKDAIDTYCVRPSVLEQATELLADLRAEIEATVIPSENPPETKLPHTIHPPDLTPRNERGYRFINQWVTELTGEEPYIARLNYSREAEKSREYGQYFEIEIITLEIELEGLTIRLTPDGLDEVVCDGQRLWAGDVFQPEPSQPLPHHPSDFDI